MTTKRVSFLVQDNARLEALPVGRFRRNLVRTRESVCASILSEPNFEIFGFRGRLPPKAAENGILWVTPIARGYRSGDTL